MNSSEESSLITQAGNVSEILQQAGYLGVVVSQCEYMYNACKVESWVQMCDDKSDREVS
jgi:hypothetical protein